MKTLNEDEFYNLFTPQINHIVRKETSDEIGDEDICSFSGCMYETYGEELDYVFNMAKTTNKVWTIIDGDDGTLFLSPGFRVFNRFGFLVCDKDYDEEQEDIKLDA